MLLLVLVMVVVVVVAVVVSLMFLRSTIDPAKSDHEKNLQHVLLTFCMQI